MIRDTSIESFHRIKSEGLLSERRLQVYSILFDHGPLTGNEAAVRFRESYGRAGVNQMNIVTRLGELRDCGVAREVGRRICSITGMKVILWDVTQNLPVKFDHSKPHRCPTCNGTGKVFTSQGRLL